MRLALFGAVTVAFASALTTFACSSTPAPAEEPDSGIKLPDDPAPIDPAPIEPPPVIIDYDASPFDNDAGAQCSGAVPEVEPNNIAGNESPLTWEMGATHSICGRVSTGDPQDLFKFTMAATTSYRYRLRQLPTIGDGNVSIDCVNSVGKTYNIVTGPFPFPPELGDVVCTVNLTTGTMADWRVDLKVCSSDPCQF